VGKEDGFDEVPTVRTSVINYGLPPLAGRIHTPADLDRLAREIRQAIVNFEPRIQNVRVFRDDRQEEATRAGTEAAGYIVEGELWGYPLAEQVRIRALLDLDIGRLRLINATSPETR
jgi:type VI secretion system protein ImpF